MAAHRRWLIAYVSLVLLFAAVGYAAASQTHPHDEINLPPGSPPGLWIDLNADKLDGLHLYQIELGDNWDENAGDDIYNKNLGNVGIGKSDPSVKLDVVGSIVATDTICDSNGCIGSGSATTYWDSNGNDIWNTNLGKVGIGTGIVNPPVTDLEVSGDVQISGEDPDLRLYESQFLGNNYRLRVNDEAFSVQNCNDQFIDSSCTTNIKIMPSGRVGIGSEATTTAQLEVSGDVQISSGNPDLRLFDTSSGEQAFMLRANLNRFHIQTCPSTFTGCDARLSIRDTGEVGINKHSPSEMLDVVGNIVASGSICSDGGANCIGAGGADGDWQIDSNDMHSQVSGRVGIGTTMNTRPATKLEVVGSAQLTGTAPGIRFNETKNDQGNYLVYHNNGHLEFRRCNHDYSDCDTTLRLERYGVGNVGVNVPDARSTLDVGGTIRANELCDENGQHCKDISDGWPIPSGWCIFSTTQGGCPSPASEWIEVSKSGGDLYRKTLRGAGNPGATGGSDRHTHPYSGTTDPDIGPWQGVAIALNSAANNGHTHDYSGTTDDTSMNSWPPYFNVVICCKI
jgi:hypothetical protein